MKYDYFVVNYLNSDNKQVAGVFKVSRYANLKRFFDSIKTITNENGEKAYCICIYHANTKQNATETATAWNDAYQVDNLLFYYLPFNYYVR